MKKLTDVVFMTLLIISASFLLPDWLSIGRTDDARFSTYKTVYPWLSREIYNVTCEVSSATDVDLCLVLSVMNAESNGNRMAKGPTVVISKERETNALGLLQIIPEYHYHGSKNDLFNTRTNIQIGTRVLKGFIRMANGSIPVALRYYNCGPYSKKTNPRYVRKVMDNYQLTKNITRVI